MSEQNQIHEEDKDKTTLTEDPISQGIKSINEMFPVISETTELLKKLQILALQCVPDGLTNIPCSGKYQEKEKLYVRTYETYLEGRKFLRILERYDPISLKLVDRAYYACNGTIIHNIVEKFVNWELQKNQNNCTPQQYVCKVAQYFLLLNNTSGKVQPEKIQEEIYDRLYAKGCNLNDLQNGQIIDTTKLSQQGHHNQLQELVIPAYHDMFSGVKGDDIYANLFLRSVYQAAFKQYASDKKNVQLIDSIFFPQKIKDVISTKKDYKKIIQKAIDQKSNRPLILAPAAIEDINQFEDHIIKDDDSAEGHAFLFMWEPDSDSNIYCFDSSGAFLGRQNNYFPKYKGFNIEPLIHDNIQENGTCFYWSMCMTKAILDNTKKYPNIKAIKNDFKNQDIILDACIEMSKIFDEKGQETIKKADKSPDEANYIRLGDSSYWLHKNYKNNRFVKPDYLEKVQELKNPQHNKLQNIRSNQKTLDSEFKEINGSIQQQQLSIYQRMRRFYNKSLKIPYIISQINKDYKKIYERDNNMSCIEFQFNGDNNEITIYNLKQPANKPKSFKLGNSEDYKQMHEILHMSPINIEKALEPFQDKTQADGTQVILPNPDDLDKRKKEDNMKSRQSPVSNSKNPLQDSRETKSDVEQTSQLQTLHKKQRSCIF